MVVNLGPTLYFPSVPICSRYLSQLMRLWYLSHGRPTKAQAHRQSLRCSHTWPMEADEGSDKFQTSSPTVHARLKNEFSEDEKYHNLMRWLISLFFVKIHKLCNKESTTVKGPMVKVKVKWEVQGVPQSKATVSAHESKRKRNRQKVTHTK